MVEHFSDPAKAEITSEKIVVGEFVDIEKPSYEKLLHEKIAQINEKAVRMVRRVCELKLDLQGFGGQGIIKSGIIVAAAACIYSGKNAVQTQSYGPESRGGACKSEVVISEEEIDFPKVVEPDVLVVMSQHAYNEYAENMKPGGTIIMDPDMIPHEKELRSVKVFRIPATKIAEELGKKNSCEHRYVRRLCGYHGHIR